MTSNTLSPALLHKMDAYWNAANYLSVGQIYIYDNPLLKEPLKLSHWPNYQRGYGRLDAWAAVRMADTMSADGLEYGLSEVRLSSGHLQGRKA